ncbi:MAG: methylglutaconyl-CoA hydratase, partial [Patiriisocius sp.]
MTAPYVKEEIQNGISTIEFFHPAHNSLPGDILEKLRKTITEAGENDAVKVIILKSGGVR